MKVPSLNPRVGFLQMGDRLSCMKECSLFMKASLSVRAVEVKGGCVVVEVRRGCVAVEVREGCVGGGGGEGRLCGGEGRRRLCGGGGEGRLWGGEGEGRLCGGRRYLSNEMLKYELMAE